MLDPAPYRGYWVLLNPQREVNQESVKELALGNSLVQPVRKVTGLWDRPGHAADTHAYRALLIGHRQSGKWLNISERFPTSTSRPEQLRRGDGVANRVGGTRPAMPGLPFRTMAPDPSVDPRQGRTRPGIGVCLFGGSSEIRPGQSVDGPTPTHDPSSSSVRSIRGYRPSFPRV